MNAPRVQSVAGKRVRLDGTMLRDRPPNVSATHPRWEETTPMPRLDVPVAANGNPDDRAARGEPPFRRVGQGLEVRELDSQTVFDQLFGAAPAR